ncbi:MAG TPA: hypothetical protein VFT06_10380 [Flavisolibacter sp.]|nr:hypothetical protein [Flavisolibacter sp.]
MTTVTSCEKAKEVNGKSVYKVGLSDGRYGESFAKEIPVGTPESDLQIEDTQWGLKVKLIAKNGFSGGGAKAAKGNESFALSYAKDLVIAMLPKMDKQPSSADLTKVVIACAEPFYSWLESKKK